MQYLFAAIQQKLNSREKLLRVEIYCTKAIVRYCPTIIYARSHYRATSARVSKVRKSITVKGPGN